MRKLLNPRTATQGAWNGSELTLPGLDPAADVVVQRWCAVAGGLALILSRVSASERSARFARAHVLYELVRQRLQQGSPPEPGAELLSDVMHEIAEVADPLTRGCLRACFQASTRPATQAADGNVPLADVRASHLLPSSLQLASRASRVCSVGTDNVDNANTSFMPDTLSQRSAELRRRLAAARGGSLALAK